MHVASGKETKMNCDLYVLIRKAASLYQKEVLDYGKLYPLFVKDFLNGHRYTDYRNAARKNEHCKNIGILEGILSSRKDLVERFFQSDAPTDKWEDELLRLYYTTDASTSHAYLDANYSESHPVSLSLGCCLEDDQMSLVAHCVNEAHLFQTAITTETLHLLLEGRLTVPLVSSNNRLVAYFFDQLCHHRLITGHWQYLLEQAGSILGSKDKRPLKHGQYSNALSLAKSNPNSFQEKIKQCIRQVKILIENSRTDNK